MSSDDTSTLGRGRSAASNRTRASSREAEVTTAHWWYSRWPKNAEAPLTALTPSTSSVSERSNASASSAVARFGATLRIVSMVRTPCELERMFSSGIPCRSAQRRHCRTTASVESTRVPSISRRTASQTNSFIFSAGKFSHQGLLQLTSSTVKCATHRMAIGPDGNASWRFIRELIWSGGVWSPGSPVFPQEAGFLFMETNRRSRKQIVRKTMEVANIPDHSNHHLLFSKRKCGMMAPVGNPKSDSRTEKTDVLQGTLALMALKTLDVLGPLHGYGIARRIEQISGDILAVNQGTLYPVLLKLEQEGAISSEWGASENNRRARFYRLTRLGRKLLETETRDWEQTAAIIARFFAVKAEDLT